MAEPEAPPIDSIVWVFKRTGRAARVIRIRSYANHDVVEFYFCGLNTIRKTSPRKFLQDFTRLS